MRVVQLSDTHLSQRGGVTTANFERLARFVNTTLAPDLVVTTGDLAMADPDREPDLVAARLLHDLVDAPVRMLPGNHDVGEVGPDPWRGVTATDRRRDAYCAVFGADRWLELVDGWAVLGINSQLCGSGLAAEAEQWAWLASALEVVGARPVLLFGHKPLFWPMPGPSGDPTLALPPADRDRLLGLFAPGQLRLVASGHLHRYRRRRRDDLLEVWAPSTAFLAGEDSDEELPEGLEQLGVVDYRCSAGAVEARFATVPELEQLDVHAVPEFEATLAAMAGT